MTASTRLLSPLALALALACRTAPDSTNPGETGPTASAPIDDADAADALPETEPPPSDGGAATADTADAAESGESAGPSSASTAGEPGESSESGGAAGTVATPEPTPTPSSAKASAELPKPIFGKGNAGCGRDPGVGEAVKPFTLKTPAGKDISLASLRGKVVLLNFWGTWCKPCLKELPEFERLYRLYKKSGLVLVAIATDSDPAPVDAFAKERRLSAKMAIGGEEVANAYKSPNFPFSFVVDPKGMIRASYRGFKPECLGQLEQDLREELAKAR